MSVPSKPRSTVSKPRTRDNRFSLTDKAYLQLRASNPLSEMPDRPMCCAVSLGSHQLQAVWPPVGMGPVFLAWDPGSKTLVVGVGVSQ